MIDFLKYTQNFPHYLEKLKKLMPQSLSQLIQLNRSTQGPLPRAAVYVFYEGKSRNPLYVGRTNRLINRLQEHGAVSSTHYGASFAFLLAKDQAKKDLIDCTKS